ncbi:MAG: hypothetical protein O2854_01395 [Chloroflexi bacterium]|nr:hypothetical protein [Chloroflexota bacterium]
MNSTVLLMGLRTVGPFLMLALSALSLTLSDAWRLWVELADRASAAELLNVWVVSRIFEVLSSPWFVIAPIFFLISIAALIVRDGRWHGAILSICIGAQMPGLISHTQFQWLHLFSSDFTFNGQPGMVIVAAALISLPIAFFSFRTASVLEDNQEWLEAGDVDSSDVENAYLANVMFLGKMVAAALLISGAIVSLSFGLRIGLDSVADQVGAWWVIWAAPVVVALLGIGLYGLFQNRTVGLQRIEPKDDLIEA